MFITLFVIILSVRVTAECKFHTEYLLLRGAAHFALFCEQYWLACSATAILKSDSTASHCK